MKKRSDNINSNDKKRVFIAINLEQDTKQHLANIQEKINKFRDSKSKIKIVEKKNLHISLKFLGNLNSLELEKTWLVLQKISFKCQPFEVKVSKNIGIFSSRKIPRVIWVGLEKGINEISEIYGAIEQELAKESFWRSEKNFTPHITLGRVKYLKYPNKLTELLKDIEIPEISQSIHSVELMESQLTPQGPIYTVRSKFPFFK